MVDMTYQKALAWLYTSLPVYQNIGIGAYKPGLDHITEMVNYLGNPHREWNSIHVGGTNGKGSVSHLLAAVLQLSGYKTGLYTSPHLLDFRERIRMNGEKIDKDYVTNFVAEHQKTFKVLNPSFFELTTAMAFAWFRDCGADWVVAEVGLGGRLDSTNVLTPRMSVITNISLDHTHLLGSTPEAIATEKAGIIKPGVPVVIGHVWQAEAWDVFVKAASRLDSDLYHAVTGGQIKAFYEEKNHLRYDTLHYGEVLGELCSDAQPENAATVLTAIDVLHKSGVKIPTHAVQEGFAHVTTLTGLMGRWQKLHDKPCVVCDTGHNPDAWKYLSAQLNKVAGKYATLRMVIGLSGDKDITGILQQMPVDAVYYFTRAQGDRGMDPDVLADVSKGMELKGTVFTTVREAVSAAWKEASEQDFIFIGGSTFVVAEGMAFDFSS